MRFYSRIVVAFLPSFIADCKSSSILSFMRFRKVTMLRDEKVSRSSFSCTWTIDAVAQTINAMSESVDNVSASLKRFGVIDYAVFVFMLVVCSIVGLYFGYQDHVKHKANKLKSRRGSAALDYLLGGKNVQVFPGQLKDSNIRAFQNFAIHSRNVLGCIFRFRNHAFGHEH